MKSYQVVVFFVLFLCMSSMINAQKLDSKNYHAIRGSLNNSAVKFEKEKAGRVVFLGGSITYNNGWRDSVCSLIQQKFPETEFDFINAGIPSMGSTPAAFRFERDVLKNGKVDLLFVEAAVNDDTNKTENKEIIRGMEGIVRHAKIANPLCDIVMLHFVDPAKMEDYKKGKIPEVIQQRSVRRRSPHPGSCGRRCRRPTCRCVPSSPTGARALERTAGSGRRRPGRPVRRERAPPPPLQGVMVVVTV